MLSLKTGYTKWNNFLNQYKLQSIGAVLPLKLWIFGARYHAFCQYVHLRSSSSPFPASSRSLSFADMLVYELWTWSGHQRAIGEQIKQPEWVWGQLLCHRHEWGKSCGSSALENDGPCQQTSVWAIGLANSPWLFNSCFLLPLKVSRLLKEGVRETTLRDCFC